MNSRTIGILGATGLVGRFVARTLYHQNVRDLKLGGRRADALASLGRDLDAKTETVDLFDNEQLERFCENSAVVVNCAGPSYAVLDRVASAADRMGASYVDVSGDGPAYQLLMEKDAFGGDTSAILSAGMLPGLANLTALSMTDSPGGQLTVYSGGAEILSYTGAADLVLSLNEGQNDVGGGEYWYGEALASWELGRRTSRRLSPMENVALEFFPGVVSAVPFLSADSERLAMRQQLSGLRWYNVFGGKHLKGVLNRVRGALDNDDVSLDEATRAVLNASELDLFGLRPYYNMIFVLEQHGMPTSRVVIQTDSSAKLTGATAVSAVVSLLKGETPPGVSFADDVLDPHTTLQDVERFGATMSVHACVLEPGSLVEEGAL